MTIRSWAAGRVRAAGAAATGLLDPVIGRFLDDLDVVDMGLAHAGAGDLDEAAALAHRGDVLAAAVAHAGAQAPGELADDADHAALVGDAPLDALGDELVGVVLGVLEVAVGRALL